MTAFSEFDEDATVREILADNGVFEAHRLVAEYECFRRRQDGEVQQILVRVFDMGNDNPQARYSWRVSVPESQNPDRVLGNPGDSILRAGHIVHWNELETDDRKEM